MSASTKDELDNEWEALDWRGQLRFPITSAIPYYFRWKTLNLKLMMADLQEMSSRYKIQVAEELLDVVRGEAELMCRRMAEIIREKRLEIQTASE